MLRFYGTLGPACAQVDVLCTMLDDGMTGARLNLSHGELSQYADWIGALRQAQAHTGHRCDLLIDLEGAEVRIGALAAPMPLAVGGTVRLGAGGVPFPQAALDALRLDTTLTIDDGAIMLAVTALHADHADCRVLRGGLLHGHKGVALSVAELRLPCLSDADRRHLATAAQVGVTEVMLPFARSEADLNDVRAALAHHGLSCARLLAKVEDCQGLATLAGWAHLADEIVIARGDLGMQMPLAELPGAQQDIARICRAQNVPFMVVTQLLHSMITAPQPTRAEVSDIAHAVWDGAASLMLTGETAIGAHPVTAMRALIDTARAAEHYSAQTKKA